MELILAISMFLFYGIAWVLGWWRFQTSSGGSDTQGTDASGSLFSPARLAVGISICVILGLAVQSAFLVVKIQNWLTQQLAPSGWFIWGMIASWILAAGLVLQLNHRRMHVFGLFILPIAIILFIIGNVMGAPLPLLETTGNSIWRWIHSLSLLVGTVAVVFAFAAGVLYMIQSHRLKHKKPSLGFRLPSLEKLQGNGERGLLVSSVALASGLISGIIMNLFTHSGNPIIDWAHPVVWSSSLLLCWLVLATAFNLLYQPARYGRKVAYLTIVSGVFLAMELVVVLVSGHGTQPDVSPGNVPDAPPLAARPLQED